jgi:hypothetical protein
MTSFRGGCLLQLKRTRSGNARSADRHVQDDDNAHAGHCSPLEGTGERRKGMNTLLFADPNLGGCPRPLFQTVRH